MAASSSLPTLADLAPLSTASKEDFLTSANLLFETAPPLAEALYTRHQSSPFKDYGEVISYAREAIDAMNDKDKLAVINAHPQIGVRPQAAAQGELSSFSYHEQGLAKEVQQQKHDQALEDVYTQLEQLNEEYRQRFGFCFVVFVNGRSKAELLPVLRERLQRTREQELETGLEAMMLIAQDRLRKMAENSKL